MQIEITKTDLTEMLKLLMWSQNFINSTSKSTRDKDHARRISRIMQRLNGKNKDAKIIYGALQQMHPRKADAVEQ